jgi:Icc protein
MLKSTATVVGGFAIGCGGKTGTQPKTLTSAKREGVIRIAHVTDTHMDLHLEETVALMERLVVTINRDFPDLDCVLFGGDNFNNNTAPGEDAATFKKIIGSLSCPAYAIRGNKESKHALEAGGYSLSSFQQNFDAGLKWVGRDWKLDLKDITVLGVDTTIDGADNGLFTAESFAFVETELAANPSRKHILLNHHPYENFWNSTDQKDIHKYVLGNAEEAHTRLFGSDNLVLTLSGHKHLDHVTTHRGVLSIATIGFVASPNPENLSDRRFRIIEIAGDRIDQQIASIA